MFRRHISPPYSGTKSKTIKKPEEAGSILWGYKPEYRTLHDFYIFILTYIQMQFVLTMQIFILCLQRRLIRVP
jgi:hypothetical protein